MNNLNEQYRKEVKWVKDNIVKAKKNDIIKSDEMHCGQPMDKYVGTDFVDWTHKCTKCKGMYDCA
jgi:hypothetical protein